VSSSRQKTLCCSALRDTRDCFDRNVNKTRFSNYKILMKERSPSPCDSPFSLTSQTLQQRELTINTYQNNLIETEDSRLVVLETSARELRRRRSELLKANEREEQLKQKIDDSNYEIDGLREQIVSLEREKDEVIKTESELRQELKEKDSLNKGLMDRLVEEANAHKETILQHEVSLSPPCSC
jgi:DNA repair exonuclease SbcCD ATPase subunit